MTAINKILKMAEDNNGMVTSAMIDAANISRGCLKYLVDRGKLQQSGMYPLRQVQESLPDRCNPCGLMNCPCVLKQTRD